MNELEQLKTLLSRGYRPLGFLVEVSEKEVEKGLPSSYLGKYTKAFGLQSPEGKWGWFPLVENNAIEFAQGLVDERNRIIGYEPKVYCTVVGEKAVHGRILYLDQVIESLRNNLGWDVQEGNKPNLIEVTFKVEGDDYNAVLKHVEDVGKVGLILSLRNRTGFIVDYFSSGVKTAGQEIPAYLGQVETFGRGVHKYDFDEIQHLLEDDDNWKEAALALQLFYSQVTKRTKILVGWAIIEGIFVSKPERLLDKKERKAILKIIKNSGILSGDKLTKLDNAISNPDRLSKEGRNERIANRISDLLGEKYQVIYDQVIDLSRLRGKLGHTMGDSSPSIDKHVSFIERVLRKYIQKRNSDINFLAE